MGGLLKQSGRLREHLRYPRTTKLASETAKGSHRKSQRSECLERLSEHSGVSGKHLGQLRGRLTTQEDSGNVLDSSRNDSGCHREDSGSARDDSGSAQDVPVNARDHPVSVHNDYGRQRMA
eukprot:sb/3476096/